MIFIKYFVRFLVESAGMALAETGAHPSVSPKSLPAPMKRPVPLEMGTTDTLEFPIQSSTKGELT